MMRQYWCPVDGVLVSGDARGVWWQFHEDCSRYVEHELIDEAHSWDVEVWPFDDEDYVYYRAACACGYRSTKQVKERRAEWLWRDHYLRAKAQLSGRVDTSSV